MVQTATMRDALAVAYDAEASHAALYTTAPGATAGTEVTGGTPAYARQPVTWGAPTNGVMTAQVTFDVPAGTTVVGAGVHDAVSAGNYLDGAAVTSQAFATQGQYVLNLTYTQT